MEPLLDPSIVRGTMWHVAQKRTQQSLSGHSTRMDCKIRNVSKLLDLTSSRKHAQFQVLPFKWHNAPIPAYVKH